MTDQACCTAKDVDPEDWFIGRDGLQYPDEPFTASDEEIQEVITTRRWEGIANAVEHARGYVIGQKRRDALIRRRRAKQACFDCPMRLQCLQFSLDNRIPYGTFGGYYEEERREILAEIDRRKKGVD